MKRNLLTLFLSLFALASLRADLIWYEGFNYVNGPINAVGTNNTGGTNWFRHSGTGNDAFVNNNKLEVSDATTPSRSDDVNRLFCNGACAYTNSGTILYAAFTANFTNLPTAGGTYFSHFLITSSQFPCRIWAWRTGTFFNNTFRIGVSAGSQGSPNRVINVDLQTNVEYRIVAKWDPTVGSATLWVNPLAETEAGTGLTSDTTGVNVNPPIGFAFRQASGNGTFVTISNLAVATSFDEAATNQWDRTPATPVLVRDLQNSTNFVGAPVSLSVLPTGQSLGDLNYQWVKDSAFIANPGGNSNVFPIASFAVGDVGQYQVIVSNLTSGLAVTSSVAYLALDDRTIPPYFVQIPKNTTNYFNGTVVLTAAAAGPQPLGYSWTYNGNPITSPNVTGGDTATLTITGIHTNNGTAGNYTCVATNAYGSSSNTTAYAQAIAAQQASVAFLRTLVDTVNYNSTNSTSMYQVTGAVTTYTNITTGNTASYYLQDATAGINIFATFGSTWRPTQGDIVTFVGVLSSFNSTLELLADTVGNPSSSYTILSNNIALLPPPRPIPFTITNNLAFCETNLEGSFVMLTNVYFGANAGATINTNTSANATSIVVTNASGQTFNIGFAAIDSDTAGQTLPAFAYAIVGPFNQNLANTATPRNAGYQVTLTRFSDIITNPLSLSISNAGPSPLLRWTAAPVSYSYSIQGATNVNGPYAVLPQFYGKLSGAQEVPANGSAGVGYGTIVLDQYQTNITVNLSFSGLGTSATAAHIHGPAAPGVNAGVLFGFTGVPSATSGSIPQQTFLINATQLNYLKSGLLYFNIHTSGFGGGEIRAQIVPIPVRFSDSNGSYPETAPGNQRFYKLTTP